MKDTNASINNVVEIKPPQVCKLESVGTCNLKHPTYALTTTAPEVKEACIARPPGIDWVFFKPKDSKRFTLMQHFYGKLTQKQCQLLVDFYRLHTQEGYVYTVDNLCQWAMQELEGVAILMKILDKAEHLTNEEELQSLDPDLAKLIYTLQFWQQDNLHEIL